MVDFKDYEVDLPPIDDSCKDGKCEHLHIVKVSNKPQNNEYTGLKPRVRAVESTAAPPPVEQPHDHSHEIKTNHTELAELMPKGVNFAKCADGSCGNSVIQNSKITRKFKECENCGANTVPNSSDLCPTCGIKEPQDEEDKENFWNESNIDSEKIGDNE